MSIISLTVAPLMQKDNVAFEPWETWYWGLIPLGIMLIGTVLVWYFFWRTSIDITADPTSPASKMEEGAPQEDTAKHDDSAKKEEEEAAAPNVEEQEVEA
jgi:hypothetical protein